MTKEHNSTLVQALYQIGVIQFGEFKLKSGQTSPLYINLRKIISYPDILRSVANAMWEKSQTIPYDLVCGVPYTALPIATCLSLQQNIPMVMRRKEQKDYGTKQTIEGEFTPGQSCLVVEDVVTTGSSIIETAEQLERVNLKVSNVIALIDREQGGKENLQPKYQFHSILTLSDSLRTLLDANLLDDKEKSIVKQFLERN